ncbi:RNA polymerase beta subunit, chloroplastic [Tanacetum coccineum]
MPPKRTTTLMTDATIKALIAQGVATTLAEYEANRGSKNSDDSHDSESSRRTERATRECTYSDFLKCQPLNFKGINSHFKTVSHEVAYGMTCKTLKKMMTNKYYPRGKIKKLEIELCNLKVKGTDVVSYNQHFQELALMCGRMFPGESDEAEKQVENKRKLDNDNQAQQQPPNKQNMAMAYSAGSSEKKEYVGTLPLCNKCKFHHNGPCTVKCANCKRVGHLTRDYRSPANTNNQRTLTCYECGNQGNYISDCPKLKNRNHGNQAGGTEERGMVYALGGGETDQDLDNMEDDINA